VVRDAIELCDLLDTQFLWVDSLCIIQDDPVLKYRQLELMAEIYNSATLSIIACWGKSANEPLTTLLDKETQDSHGMFPCLDEKAFLRRISKPESHRPLRPKDGSILKAVKESTYNSRGWTFQEQILSRRRLFFLSDDIAFQCRSDLFSLHGTLDAILTKINHSKFKTLARTELNFTEIYEIQKQVRRLASGKAWPASIGHLDWIWASHGNPPAIWDRNFSIWTEIVEDYSAKHFSFDDDILNAFTGIQTAFAGYSSWKMIQGLPETLIHVALLWIPLENTVRRTMPKSSSNQFPSWSWTGWKGGISYVLSYKDDVISDFISHISFSSDIQNECTSKKTHWKEAVVKDHISWTRMVAWVVMNKHPTPDVELKIDIKGTTVPSTWFFISSTSRAESGDLQISQLACPTHDAKVCRVLYGTNEPHLSRSFHLNLPDHYFLLLSSVRYSSIQEVNSVLLTDEEAHIYQLAEDNSMFQQKDEPQLDITIGTIHNVMFIRMLDEVHAERVAIGQIRADVWVQLSSSERSLRLV
jgi:Heterokaryon incompatibility protein (HET)